MYVIDAKHRERVARLPSGASGSLLQLEKGHDEQSIIACYGGRHGEAIGFDSATFEVRTRLALQEPSGCYRLSPR